MCEVPLRSVGLAHGLPYETGAMVELMDFVGLSAGLACLEFAEFDMMERHG